MHPNRLLVFLGWPEDIPGGSRRAYWRVVKVIEVFLVAQTWFIRFRMAWRRLSHESKKSVAPKTQSKTEQK